MHPPTRQTANKDTLNFTYPSCRIINDAIAIKLLYELHTHTQTEAQFAKLINRSVGYLRLINERMLSGPPCIGERPSFFTHVRNLARERRRVRDKF